MSELSKLQMGTSECNEELEYFPSGTGEEKNLKVNIHGFRLIGNHLECWHHCIKYVKRLHSVLLTRRGFPVKLNTLYYTSIST